MNKEMGGTSIDLSRKSSVNDKMSNARIAEYDSKYPASFSVQCKEILARAMKSHLRRPQDFRVRMIRNLIMGLLGGVVFLDAGHGQTGPQTRLSSFFFLLIMATLNSFTQVTLIILDRPCVLSRETFWELPCFGVFAWLNLARSSSSSLFPPPPPPLFFFFFLDFFSLFWQHVVSTNTIYFFSPLLFSWHPSCFSQSPNILWLDFSVHPKLSFIISSWALELLFFPSVL